MSNKKWYTTSEAAKLLGISRISAFRRIRAGRMKAERHGRAYLIPASELPTAEGAAASGEEIDLAVKRVVREYGETLKRLASE